uniref:Uncharacterized protein n=1 Tax=Arundo donax TaxID=35708 RepID=A0A0A9DHJ5_ARUDO
MRWQTNSSLSLQIPIVISNHQILIIPMHNNMMRKIYEEEFMML